MGNKNLIYLLIAVMLSISSPELMAEIYIAKKGDNLIKIIRKNFKKSKIYGPHGLLKEVIALNPEIKNPNFISRKQPIRLPSKLKETVVASSPAPEEPEREVAELDPHGKNESFDYWTLKILYGIKLQSLEQSNTLSSFNLESLPTDVLRLESEFKYDTYKFTTAIETYTFSYASSNRSHQEKFSHFELNGVWNHYLLGFSFKEVPIIKGTSTSLELTQEGQIGLSLGYDKTWTLPTNKPTSINSRSILTIPFKNSSSKPEASLKSISGFELKENVQLSRSLLKKSEYSLDLIWQNEFTYSKTSRQLTWGSNSGKVDLTRIEIKSILGVGYNF